MTCLIWSVISFILGMAVIAGWGLYMSFTGKQLYHK